MGEENIRAEKVGSREKIAESVFYIHKKACRRGDRERIERRVINQEMAFFGKAAGPKALGHRELLEHGYHHRGRRQKRHEVGI